MTPLIDTPRRRVALIGGTWSWRGHETTGEWYQRGSPFVTYLEARGLEVAAKDRPFIWDSRIGGLPWQRNRFQCWDAAGAQLAVWLDWTDHHVGITAPIQALIVHSHALQLVLMSLAYHGCRRVPTLISVGSPIRHDMGQAAALARPHIDLWLHLGATGWWRDSMRWLGSWFDGQLTVQQDAIWYEDDGQVACAADLSVCVPGVGHSGLLREPNFFHYWHEWGWLDWIGRPTRP